MSQLPKPRRSLPLATGGPLIGPMAWGMWRLSGSSQQAATLVRTALEVGFNLLDTADIYGFDGNTGFGAAETLLGSVFAAEAQLRKGVVLASKGGICPPLPYDQSRDYLAAAIDASLSRLGVEHIDLYQIHRPDILAHPQEVARVLEDALSAGKIGFVGVSNHTASQIETLQHFLPMPLASTQSEISPLRITCFETGELDQALRMGLLPLAWSPLGGGRLIAPVSERDHSVAAALDKVASEQGVSRSVAAYSWLLAHPAGIVPIIGTQRRDRIQEAAAAVDVIWTREDWYAVFAAARGEKLP